MYSRAELLLKYLQYQLRASNSKGHRIHSPFVFDFIIKVLNDRTFYPAFKEIELQRTSLLSDNTILHVNDYGAGSGYSKTNARKVSEIAKHALKPAKYAKLLYRMVRYFEPDTIVELGTSLGITTAYLAKARSSAKVWTLEGAESIAQKAARVIRELDISNVKHITGNFDETFAALLHSIPKTDFVFLDGNHRYQPTVDYFNMLLPVIHEYSVVVMDDIHWSREMENAWDYCRLYPAVTLNIDLFFIGILLFRKDFRIPQNFTIRF